MKKNKLIFGTVISVNKLSSLILGANNKTYLETDCTFPLMVGDNVTFYPSKGFAKNITLSYLKPVDSRPVCPVFYVDFYS